MQALAIKYRPKIWDDVTEQGEIKVILSQQLNSNELQHCYLFVGGAGTGKTTCARIFANEINKGIGNPIELDAASNNSVDDMRDLIAQAKTRSLDSEYKVFIIDECHMITVQGWNAILKLIEEPPTYSIFIFCTTDPQKIPKTILSRVQRYDFQRISQTGICRRLELIYQAEAVENKWEADYNYKEGMEYIAKIADGGMRDAITMLDKCLAYSEKLTIENVIKALGVADYTVMCSLTDSVLYERDRDIIAIIEDLYTSGKDLKQFAKDYTHFVLDAKKYIIGCPKQYIMIPDVKEYMDVLDNISKIENIEELLSDLLEVLISLSANIRYSTSPKIDIEASLMCWRK